VKEKKAQGVIFLLLKFCDPHAFDYPYIKQSLDEAGIPVMLMEINDPIPSGGQLKTRFEAFLEML
jgi:benzoyl-CoA reductase/2-hydroxyglutaryl-CoA dehydratase subunit BcrC/BadD/HgdB